VSEDYLKEEITLSQAKLLISSMAESQSILMLSAPGVGKSDLVMQAATEAGLECRSLLGTQIAPEDVSGIPRIIGERSVFCPPRLLLPEDNKPFCLFLDELPATTPDIQKAFYSLLLERRIGEFKLPRGTWVVAAGNRQEDRALVRSISSALINRVVILNIRADVDEWMHWAVNNRVRNDIVSFIALKPDALMREVPNIPVPFSTPRSWTLLSYALTICEDKKILDNQIQRALAFGRISPQDASLFCTMAEEKIADLLTVPEYFAHPERLPESDTAIWFVLSTIRNQIQLNQIKGIPEIHVNNFLNALSTEQRIGLITGFIEKWTELGAEQSLLKTIREITDI
jgi:MoxR-like ATPase